MAQPGRDLEPMETTLVCRLRHGPTGTPEGWNVGGIIRSQRLSGLWEGQFSGSESNFLERLSAEARTAGVCPNHVRILRYVIAGVITGRGHSVAGPGGF